MSVVVQVTRIQTERINQSLNQEAGRETGRSFLHVSDGSDTLLNAALIHSVLLLFHLCVFALLVYSSPLFCWHESL